MADVIYRDIRHWKNSPIQKLVLSDATDNEKVYFFHPAAESNYEVLAVTRRDAHASERLVGWMFRAVFNCVENDVENRITDLESRHGHTFSATLILKPDSTAGHGRTVSITISSPIGLSWQIVKGAAGPEFSVIITKALTSLDQAGVFWQDDTETISDPIT